MEQVERGSKDTFWDSFPEVLCGGPTLTGWAHDCPLCQGEMTVKYNEWTTAEPMNYICVKCGAKFTAHELAEILAYNEC